jgi:hypothetical protein
MVFHASNALGQLLDPVAAILTPDVAEQLQHLQIGPAALSRIEELAAKANEGQLSEAENAEYRDYVDSMDLVAILQAKARKLFAGRAKL